MLMIARLPNVPRIVAATTGVSTGVSSNSEYTSHTCLFNKCLILNQQNAGATIAPHTRSVKVKLHSSNSPERMELTPVLKSAMMTDALEMKHQILNSSVTGESQFR